MPCLINTVSNPDSNDQFDLGESVTVTWTNNGDCTTNPKRVTEIKLQRNISGSWSDVETLWTGNTNVTANSQSVSMPNSVPVYGDVYRVRLKYELVGR